MQVAFTEVPTHLATNSINQRTDLASHRVRLADVKTVTAPKTIVSCRHGAVALSDDIGPSLTTSSCNQSRLRCGSIALSFL